MPEKKIISYKNCKYNEYKQNNYMMLYLPCQMDGSFFYELNEPFFLKLIEPNQKINHHIRSTKINQANENKYKKSKYNLLKFST